MVEMAVEVRMVVYEDDSVHIQYLDGSRLQLSPCGSEFLFEKAPPTSAHPLEQPERIRQRTHFVISAYREQLQRALDFRNSFATCPFLSENIIPSERKKCIFIDISEVRWPDLGADERVTCLPGGTVKVTSLDGHAYLCLPTSQHEFTVHFLCKVSQKPDSLLVLSERKNQAKEDKLVGKAGEIPTCGSLPGQRLKSKGNELHCQAVKAEEPLEEPCCRGAVGQKEVRPPPYTQHTYEHAWVQQRYSVAACPDEWKYPLSLASRFHSKIHSLSGTDAALTQSTCAASDVSEERGQEVSVLPRALSLSCPAPHLHRWSLCGSLPLGQSDEEYSYPELVKVVWHEGVTYRLTHKNMNSIEIYPGDGSVFKSEGPYLGDFFTYGCNQGSEEREEKMYSVNNLPPDRPGSLFSVCTLIKQATRILQHCAERKLSLSHNYCMCCWKTVPGRSDNNTLPLLLRESFIPSVGRLLAYSDDKVHVIFLDGVTLTLNWNFGSFTENRQVNQGLSLGWCKLSFPDGHDQIIQISNSGPHEGYVSTVMSWCRRLTQRSQQEVLTYPASSVPEENWCVASELEKIQKFNSLLENSGVLNQISNKKNEQSSEYIPKYSDILLEEVNESKVSVALKKISEVIQDIDCLLSNSKK